MKLFQDLLLAVGVALTPCSLALGDVLWVDDDGGVGIDYTDIQPAIDAAQAGDVLVVAPGDYGGFDLDIGLTIMNSSADQSAHVLGHATISNVASPTGAVLTGLRMETLSVSNSTAPIVLDFLKFDPPNDLPSSAIVQVSGNHDVRMNLCEVADGYPGDLEHAVAVAGSRFEVVASQLRGRGGYSIDCFGVVAGHGGSGLICTSGAAAFVFLSDCHGGDGGDTESFCEWTDPWAGDGGDGLGVYDTSTALVAGLASNVLGEGQGGYGDEFPTFTDGADGYGFSANGASAVRYSGVTVESQSVAAGASAEEAIPGDPFLELFGTQQAGRVISLWVHGEPGASAFVHLGRNAIVQPQAGQYVEQLTTRERSFSLGTLPPSGKKKLDFTIPGWLPIGFTFFAQGEVVFAGGEHRLTNSTPIVLRHLP